LLISVLGAGYVGLVTAACLARMGHEIRCIEIDPSRLAQLERGLVPIAEPGLTELVQEATANQRLSFHGTSAATRGTELTIVAVGTLEDDGETWTDRFVRGAVLALASDPDGPRQIVIRSTLMPGSANSILGEARAIDPRVEVAHNPEFTREGSAVADFLSPDRVVIGIESTERESTVRQALSAIYEPLGAPIVVTDLATAETIKVGSNVFLATKIAYANELARLCAATGAEVEAVVDALGLDRRIGRAFLSPGPGFGGACLPSQSRELPAVATRLGVHTPLIAAIASSNAEAAQWQVERLASELERPLRGAIVALLGVTFKAGTDDLRESPALRIATLLAEQGAIVRLYDPSGAERAAELLSAAWVPSEVFAGAVEATSGADAAMVLTEWPEFGELDWTAISGAMRGRLVVDARGIVDRDAAMDAGLDIVVLGRRQRSPQPVEAG
jgi:UDPglucose 6-dehydrogenase